jgi:gamma-glutamyltranspeptidase / glutathione hydrolase
MKRVHSSRTAILLGAALFMGAFPQNRVAAREPARGRHAMVASQHELASKVGVSILKRGGNAVDAAIAVGLALAVVYPEAGNIGGGGFMLIRDKNGHATAIDYREMAPSAAHRDLFIGNAGQLVTGEGSSTVGYRASGVPGTLAGFELAFRRYGSKKVSWAELVRPAKALASSGFVISHRFAGLFKEYAESLGKYDDSRRIFLNNGRFFEDGDVIRQPELAATLGRIERQGAREFYRGRTAELIAADMLRNGGLITRDDLQKYKAKERVPLRGTYRGYEIISMPPPSSGGVVMLEALNILEGYDIRPLAHNSAAKYHLVTEAMRRAFADRSEFLGDPDFSRLPVEGLIDKRYAARLRESIRNDRATLSRDVGPGSPAGAEPSDTTHFTIIDREGMVVSNSYTLNDLYGSRVTIKGTGVLMNDEMDDFATKPGQPNLYGLIQGTRNAIQPGKRPLSSMTPTIVLRKDGSVWFALGARGGPRIISAVMQSIVNVIDFDMEIQQALDSPRIHHQWLPDELWVEPNGMSPETSRILQKYGHAFISVPKNVGSATAVMVDEKGIRLGAVDSRSDGAAVGY